MTHRANSAAIPVVVALLAATTAASALAASVEVGPRDGDLVGSDSQTLQAAVDRVAAEGGGTVYVKSGYYTMYDALHLRSGVSVVGVGSAPVLRHADSFTTRLAQDARTGCDRLVVANPSGLGKGVGVAISDDTHASGRKVALRTVKAVEGNAVILNRELELDYLVARNGKVETTHPVISGEQVRRVRLENLIADGNRASTRPADGCRGAAIYLWQSERCTVADCTARNFPGDGISLQATSRITVDSCHVYHNSGSGICVGSASHHAEITDCHVHDNGADGLCLDWGVDASRFADNVVEGNGGDGISLGHQCADNLLIGNTVERNGRHGVAFRTEAGPAGAMRNTLQANIIRDNGQRQTGDGIHIQAGAQDITITGNTIEDTARDGRVTQRHGIFVARGAAGIKTRGNTIRGHPGEMVVEEG